MNVRWARVWLIFGRELRDQVRDQRTMFMIFILPVLLYPLIGLGLGQLVGAFADKQRTVVVVGAEFLPAARAQPVAGVVAGVASAPLPQAPLPSLLEPGGKRFNPALFLSPGDADKLAVRTERHGPPWTDAEQRRLLLRSGEADAVVLIPPEIARYLDEQDRVDIPIAYNSADERSQITYLRVERVIDRWRDVILESRRRQEGRPEGATQPVRTEAHDVARAQESGGAVWAKIFPFLLVLMSLLGAFYPSVDLCAGEKERGTMETLLISPASRPEIVLGKFFTVMLASIVMAILNLSSMGVTAWAMAAQLQPSGAGGGGGGVASAARLLTAPSLESMGWMLLLLVPLAAFFSALCVALAIQARSMKEGQYYLTPIYVVVLPLALVALAPGIELDLFTSLLPVTGVSLLMRSLMQGDYELARRFFLPVLLPIVVYGLVSLRWAVDQFKSESVLFRAGERFDLAGWLRHLWRDKPATPAPGQALLCFVLIGVAAFYVASRPIHPLWATAFVQVGVIFGIPVLLACLLARNPRRTLRFRAPRFWDIALGGLLPIALFPLVCELRLWVEELFPTPDVVSERVKEMMALMPNLSTMFVLMAVLPAICEEVAFRGYILSGLEHSYRPAWAITLSALLFGFLHVLLSLFNQLFNATLLGLVLGLLAVRSRSLIPCIVFHLVNNALGIFVGAAAQSHARFSELFLRDSQRVLFQTRWLLLGSAFAVVMLIGVFRRRPPALHAMEAGGRGGSSAADSAAREAGPGVLGEDT